ncbi:MAG TPA: hydroxyphenylacetyl-CoA thioesterase PaaI [Burkholderiales bacterium]|nr:hydroxyphenylacetyl-CoA thioesterase PaaI [Burkholderiales bacterium]
MERQKLAQLASEAMWAGDRASKLLGMKIEEVRPGYARLSMRVTRDMLNGYDTCHGGIIFTLADSAFGYACNSHNQLSVAASCSIDFLAPARTGDVLTATAAELARAGRAGVYDIRVEKQDGTVVATFRGRSTTIRGHWVNTAGAGA